MNQLESRLEDVLTPLDVAVIGCVVNGPGEAKEADLGITGGSPSNLVYVGGTADHKVKNEQLVDHFEQLIRQKIEEKKQLEEAIIAKD
jgi:(E)-4-hydroxy-3-methylbut-2-enyl-diphosphate synthase